MDRAACKPLAGAAVAFALAAPLAAHAQATSRLCSGTAGEAPGPACLAARQELGTLPPGPLYWNIYAFADARAKDRAPPPRGTVVRAFGQMWLFDVGGGKGTELQGWRHLADVGPLPMEAMGRDGKFSVQYLKSTFTPGMTAPVHTHSGPEAFYALSGGTCLETPDGAQVGRGEGHSLMVKRGPPMLLQAVGRDNRQGFAMILHGEGSPPTTLTSDWAPKGLCPKE